MHEVSIVQALVDQVEGEVRRSGHEGRVLRLAVVVGRLSGVNADSLRFAFQILAPGTLVESARLDITEPPAEVVCAHCKARTPIDDLVAQCPVCGSGEIVIEGGRQLLLESIELED